MKNSNTVRVSEHAIDRYAERVLKMGVPDNAPIRNYIVKLITDEIKEAPFNTFNVYVNDHILIIKERVVVTIKLQR